MQSGAIQDINQVISSFESFINVIENSNQFLQIRSNEEIKNCFKLANFIEQTVFRFKSKDTITNWMDLLNKYLKDKNGQYNGYYNHDFFSIACDHLLAEFFKHKSTDINMLDISIRMYTSLMPQKRFETFLSNLLMKSASHKAILDFTLVNENAESSVLEYKLVLNKWSKNFRKEKPEELISVINEMLKFSKVEKSLHVLIGILALENVDQEEQQVKDLVLELILKKMLDRSILSKSFWLTLFKTKKSDILKICEYSEEFLESFCNFLIYIGSMMEIENVNERNEWVSNPSISICPELCYTDLLLFIKILSCENFPRKNFTIDKIKTAEVTTGCALWTNLIHDLK